MKRRTHEGVVSSAHDPFVLIMGVGVSYRLPPNARRQKLYRTCSWIW